MSALKAIKALPATTPNFDTEPVAMAAALEEEDEAALPVVEPVAPLAPPVVVAEPAPIVTPR
jgi:hypothetical protein